MFEQGGNLRQGCKGFSYFTVTTRRDGKEPQRSEARRSPTFRWLLSRHGVSRSTCERRRSNI